MENPEPRVRLEKRAVLEKIEAPGLASDLHPSITHGIRDSQPCSITEPGPLSSFVARLSDCVERCRQAAVSCLFTWPSNGLGWANDDAERRARGALFEYLHYLPR